MPAPAPILLALAARYERSTGGRTGSAVRDLLVSLEELLREANAAEGDARAVAEQHLREAQSAGILELVPFHKRDPGFIHQIRFSPANEARLYDALGRPSPSNRRQALAAQFLQAATLNVPDRWQSQWARWCERMREAALNGQSVEPFERDPGHSNARLLALLTEKSYAKKKVLLSSGKESDSSRRRMVGSCARCDRPSASARIS